MYGGDAAWDPTEADGRAWLLRALYERNPDVGSCILWFFTQRYGGCFWTDMTPLGSYMRSHGIGAVLCSSNL